jgi:ribosomal protein S18 acetylase RimI-like enzyme
MRASGGAGARTGAWSNEGLHVIRYRTFRNADPPGLLQAWHSAFAGRGAAQPSGSMMLEYFLFAKPYFDPAGLVLAEADGQVVGFALSGFGPGPGGRGLDHAEGVVCLLGVVPSHRRQGVGARLLARSEEYLRLRGARTLCAGGLGWRSPFGFGLCGGSQPAGVLASDVTLPPFLERFGYRAEGGLSVLHVSLDEPPDVADGRFMALRQRAAVRGGPWRHLSWWQECVLGPLELMELVLEDRDAGRPVARAVVWEMTDTFSPRWGEHAVGLVEVEVPPDLRRQGLSKFLLFQLLRHYHEQFFTLIEVQVPDGNEAALGMARGLGFRQVDAGRRFVKAEGA